MSDESVTSLQPCDEAVIVLVECRQLGERAANTMVEDVYTAVAGSHLPVILDLTKVKFAPSSALGALVRLRKSFKLDGRRLIVTGADTRILGALTVTRLISVLEIRKTIDDALAEIRRGS